MKNFVLFFVCLFAYSFQMNAQWAGSTTMFGNINRSGNVGIGITNPSAKLHTNGNIKITHSSPSLYLENNSTTQWSGGQILFKMLNTGSGESFSIEHERTATGAGNGSSVFFIRQTFENGNRINSMLIDGNSNDIIFNQGKFGNPTFGDVIFRNGNVQIGNISTSNNYKLAVDGKVICEEVKVQLSQNWPDYVFENDYDLKPLTEVEAYIQSKGHLPNTLSAKEIEAESGFEVSKMTINQQEKIEEIFLHLIEINKEVEELNKEIDELKEKNAELKKQLSKE